MSKKRFSFLVFFLFLALTAINATLFVKYAKAQVPGFRSPGCSDVSNPEFHSGRPYQSSACGDSVKAYFCGNEVRVTETFHKTVDYHTDSIDPNWHVEDKPYDVDLADTEFPILGNTEDVKNSQNGADTLDDASKLNEYAAWYLGGVVNKAEYGDTKNTDENLVNFSGPIQKLLPGSILDYQRIATIAQATDKVTYIDTESTTGNTPSESRVTEPQSHNQIVVCATKQIFGIKNNFIGKTVAEECYDGNDTEAKNEYRLKEWTTESLSTFRGIINSWTGSTAWNKRYPPLPWQFEKSELYDKAYKEWRGLSCPKIPVIGVFCFDNPLVSNEWSDLFTYVPLANTTDKNAKMLINTVTIQGAAGTSLSDHTYTVIEDPTHFYPHTQEVKDLSELLNKTYVPQDLKGTIPTSSTELNNNCSIANVRTNAGDELFPEKEPADIRIIASFDVDEIPCKEGYYKDGSPKSDCEGQVYIGIQTSPVKVPYAEDIWKSTVADSTSTFRKIFPKVEQGAPVSCVADIPSVTKAVYNEVSNIDNLSIIGPLHSPDEHKMDPQDAKIFFPHIGSVYEYFLKGIQTALRPQGYGEPIANGNCGNVNCGELPELPKASGSCAVGGISSRIGSIPQSLKDIVGAAAETYKVPPNLILAVMYGEGIFNRSDKNERFSNYDWTDENVKNWASCTPVPGCNDGSGDDGFIGFFSDDWQGSGGIAEKIKPDLLKLDPNRTKEPSRCNVLDAVYGLAYDLHDSADGGGPMANFQCFGLDLKADVPTSCSWTSPNQYISAIKVLENGYDLGCFTNPGSCASGGGNDALCESGGDTCEKYTNAGNTSHMACVWDVAHGN